MKKKILMMAGAFVAGAAAVTGIRHYLEKMVKEDLESFDDYEDEEDGIDDFIFEEDLSLDFDLKPDKGEDDNEEDDDEDDDDSEFSYDYLENICRQLIAHRLELSSEQSERIIYALGLRRVDDHFGSNRTGGTHE